MEQHLYAEERKQSILDLINEKKRVQVSELIERFNVTGSTIRNDLRELEDEGLLTRTHGGAIKSDIQKSFEISPKSREHTPQKINIAKKAVKLIEENDTIAIDTGSSCMLFAEYLTRTSFEALTILTYDLQIALLIHENTSYTVQVLGGVIRKDYPYVSGELVVNDLKQYSVDKVIMGTTYFDMEYGHSTPNVGTAELKKSLMKIGNEKIVLCESKKLFHKSYRQFALPNEFDYFITDASVSEKYLTKLREQDLDLIIA